MLYLQEIGPDGLAMRGVTRLKVRGHLYVQSSTSRLYIKLRSEQSESGNWRSQLNWYYYSTYGTSYLVLYLVVA